MEVYNAVRRFVFIEGHSRREAARRFGISRETARKICQYSEPPGYRRSGPPKRPKLDKFTGIIDQILADDLLRAYAESIEIRQDGRVVGQHPRSFGRGQTIYDPWHYVPVLARKPGALRNGAPFKDWVLPAGLTRVRQKLGKSDDADRQMVKILTTVLTDGLPAVEAACGKALDSGVHSADVILNILARQREVIQPLTIATPLNATVVPRSALKLRHEPVANCARYDQLRRMI